MMSALDRAIFAAAKVPATYEMIEKAVNRAVLRLPEWERRFALGIALTRLCLEGKLHRKADGNLKTMMPIYCTSPIPAGVRCPKREAKQE